MNILVTGATGFVGRNLLLKLLSNHTYEKIYVAIRNENKLRTQFKEDAFLEFPEKVIPILTDAPHWEGLQGIEFDHVVHCAGTLFSLTEKAYEDTNVEGTLGLFKKIKTPKKAVILSSQAAIGPCHLGQTEQTECDSESPLTWYGKSKLKMERKMAEVFPDLDYVVLRPPIVLGARDTATLPLFKMAKGLIQLKPGFSEKSYSFVSVDDLVSGIFRILSTSSVEHLSRKYFITTGLTTDLELISNAVRTFGREAVIIKLPHLFISGISHAVDTLPFLSRQIPSLTRDRVKEIFPNRWVVSDKAFRSKYAWASQSDLFNTLKETKDWYLKKNQL